MKYFWLMVAPIFFLFFYFPYAVELAKPELPQGLCTTFRWQYGAESAQQAAKLLNYPCHHNWIADNYDVPNHVPTAYSLHPSYLARYVEEAAGEEFWLLGSEPNLGVTYIKPEDAATFTSNWITQTETIWACCGTLQHWQYISFDWLDSYLAANGKIPDAWHIHIYFVDETGWDATLAQFQNWMAANDVVRPVVVSETAQTSGDAIPLLLHVAQSMCDKEVQAIYWYIGDRDYHNFAPSSQLTVDGKITELGKLFMELQTCQPTELPIWQTWLPMLY